MKINWIITLRHIAQCLLHNENPTNVNCNDGGHGGGKDGDNDDLNDSGLKIIDIV